jgi:hypothetical protein
MWGQALEELERIAEPLYGLFCQQAHRERGKNSSPSEAL